MFKWWQFKKKKAYEERKQKFTELNKKFRKEHGLIVQWAFDNLDMKAMLPQTSVEAQEFSERLKSFFGGEYCKLPNSYEAWSNVNSTWDPNFDFYPLEKLTELYNRLKIEFPEPYKNKNYE